ncbi:DUF84 family protein [Niallia nealsonii]|uniref:inosine/xanthosine triphosphatase n=1 Tax=Niallia nealsonii TaxID=115979 RepID=A0A2N0Z632_9BACI|nr:DUF84 family protein [Niallia nealsonii]PKG24953.1 inosine/xanthosine triphosphatase [Niallia nealsonii]
MEICIGTKNPAKINAVKEGFQSYENASFIALNIPSLVSEQPFSDEETIQGAVNRAKGAVLEGAGDIGIGLEGGVHRTRDGLYICNWGALSTVNGEVFISGGARIPLPCEIEKQLLLGGELGIVMDQYANKHNVRHHQGAIGILTNGKITRSAMFTHVMDLLIGQYEYKNK